MTHQHVIRPAPEDAAFSAGNGWRYGLLGLPLAFVALPLYVILPNHYAREFGMPLATLGLVLLFARLFDAFIDPLLGKLSDKLFARSAKAVLAFGAIAGVFLAAGFVLLFFPPLIVQQQQTMLIAWAAVTLLITYAAYSALSIAHQSWGAMLGGTEVQRSRLVAWREALGLIGVILASILPVAGGLIASTAIFIIAIFVAWVAWTQSVKPISSFPSLANTSTHSIFKPFKNIEFKRLFAVFVLNGIASAVPATLILFFVQDRLQAPKQMEAAFLGAYFVCAALAVPLWLQGIKRMGLTKSWLLGMVLSIVIFVWAMQLGTWRHDCFYRHLCSVWHRAQCRFDHSQRPASRCDCRRWRPRPRRRRLLWLVELCHQVEFSFGCWFDFATLRADGLHTWHTAATGTDSTHYRLLPCTHRYQSSSCISTVCADDSTICLRNPPLY